MLMFYMPNLDNCTKPLPDIRVVPTIDGCGYQKKRKGYEHWFLHGSLLHSCHLPLKTYTQFKRFSAILKYIYDEVCPIYLGFAPVPNVKLVANFLAHSNLVN